MKSCTSLSERDVKFLITDNTFQHLCCGQQPHCHAAGEWNLQRMWTNKSQRATGRWPLDSRPNERVLYSQACPTDLAVLVDVVFEVVVFSDDSFVDERLVVDADGVHQWSAFRFGQPGDLCGLLVVRVLQVQTSLQGNHLTVGPSDWWKKKLVKISKISKEKKHDYFNGKINEPLLFCNTVLLWCANCLSFMSQPLSSNVTACDC